MHGIMRVGLWVVVAAGILLFESWTDKSDSAIRMLGALAFMGWLGYGALIILRGIYRFVTSR